MKKTLITCAILSLGMISCQNDEFNSMPEENSLNQEIKKIEYLFEEGMEKEEFIYQEGNTKVETSMSFEDRLIYYEFLKRNNGNIATEYTGPTRANTYNEEVFGLVLKSPNLSCSPYRELQFIMDCEDSNWKSYTSGNTGSTFVDSNGNMNFIFCIIPASNIANGLHKIENGYARSFDCEDHNTHNVYYVNGMRADKSYVNNTKWGITEDGSGNIVFYFKNTNWSSGSTGFGHKTGSNNGIIYTDDEDDDNANAWIVPTPHSLDSQRSGVLGEYEKNSEIKVHFDF